VGVELRSYTLDTGRELSGGSGGDSTPPLVGDRATGEDNEVTVGDVITDLVRNLNRHHRD